MTTDQKGAVAEMAIALKATLLGVDVFRPVAEGGRCDLIFDFGGRLWRVQCKWASRYGDVVIARTYRARRNRDGLVRRLYTPDEIDAFAIYCMAIDRCFFVPMAHAAECRRSVCDFRRPKTTSAAGFTGLTPSISKLHCDRTKGP